MAIETPAHGERLVLPYAIHLLNGPVTLLAGYARKDMLAVIEIDKVRQVMDLDPPDGAPLLDRFHKLLNLSGLLLKQAVTIHADAFRRYSGVAAGSRRVVTIEAGDLIIAGVNLVGKRDRLNRRIALVNADAGQFPSHKGRRKNDGQNTSGD